VPCSCRESATSSSANFCISGSHCAVDADCGPNGYCSPSTFHGWCGSTLYFCHTPCDTCADDNDCLAGTWCNYVGGRWACNGDNCGPAPP
jgi:hypothetical protein